MKKAECEESFRFFRFGAENGIIVVCFRLKICRIRLYEDFNRALHLQRRKVSQ